MRKNKVSPAFIIGITGFSGSGKTTLIEKILPILKKQGLSVGVLKHIHHEINLDIKGKDTDRFYCAGADFVFAHDALQGLARYRSHDKDLLNMIGRFPSDLDLIIIEGHKNFDISGIWLTDKSKEGKIRKNDYGRKRVIFRDDPGYCDKVLSYIDEEIKYFHQHRTVMAGLLMEGMNTVKGESKALLKTRRETLIEQSFAILSEVSERIVLLGSGRLPKSLNSVDHLPDIHGMKGTLAGMISAFRWAPESAWIISSVDTPLVHREAWDWLLGQRKPGTWAVLPKMPGSKVAETTASVYEPMFFKYMETLARKGTVKLHELAAHQKAATPLMPESIKNAGINADARIARSAMFTWKK